MQEICKKYDILLIMDEVVCGLGRTGTWFGYQNFGIRPDIVTMAKGVASGYAAISCTVTTEEVFELFKSDPDDPMNHFRDISTFGGCNSGPAAVLVNMQIVENENLLENAVIMGEYLLNLLQELKDRYEIIGDVRGKGLLCGVELVEDQITKKPVDESIVQAIVENCMENSVIIGMTNCSIPGFNNTLCLSPALICNKNDLEEIVNTLSVSLGKVLTQI